MAAHIRGKDEVRVRVPGGPLGWKYWGRMYQGGRDSLARSLWWVRFSPSPLSFLGCLSNGKTLVSRTRNRGSIPRRSTTIRAYRPMGRRQPGVLKIRVQSPVGPLNFGRQPDNGLPGRPGTTVLVFRRDEGSTPSPSARAAQ